ncbi:hypothetical protein EGM63_01695 [Mycobacterium avium subsp. paratuberculosis]|nr:hypothetical protein RC58_14355 [Mycobacterium avium subsp. paratuberculosis]AZA68189.1 hypothetical protein EGM63_01695 [Mycobacterium avium subsp. paratuberculosis]
MGAVMRHAFLPGPAPRAVAPAIALTTPLLEQGTSTSVLFGDRSEHGFASLETFSPPQRLAVIRLSWLTRS